MYKVTLWDTFDNETIDIKTGFRTLKQAELYIFDHYNISFEGADKIEVRDQKTNAIIGSHSTTGQKF